MLDVLKLNTGYGFWTPLVLLASGVIACLVVLIIRSFGEKRYKPKTEQTLPFLSGAGVTDPSALKVSSKNLYWGFTQGLSSVFNGLKGFHSGDVNDFVTWSIALMALILLVMLVR